MQELEKTSGLWENLKDLLARPTTPEVGHERIRGP